MEIRQLVDDFARYLYLPRLREPAVLLRAVDAGVGLLTWENESFAYADSYDEDANRYRGLLGGQVVSLTDVDAAGVLVKTDVARRQLDAEQTTAAVTPVPTGDGTGGSEPPPFLRLVAHPSAVVAHVLGQPLRPAPRPRDDRRLIP